jgi:hypothetical protein
MVAKRCCPNSSDDRHLCLGGRHKRAFSLVELEVIIYKWRPINGDYL